MPEHAVYHEFDRSRMNVMGEVAIKIIELNNWYESF